METLVTFPVPGPDARSSTLRNLLSRGLLSRAALERLEQDGPHLARARRELLALARGLLAGHALSFVTTFAVRNLKAINEAYSFAAGDAVQELLQALIEVVLLEWDPKAAFGQLMGAHWVILHSTSDRDQVVGLVNRLWAAVAAAVLDVGGRTLRPRPVVATVALPASEEYAPDDLLKMLDLAGRRAERTSSGKLFIGEGNDHGTALLGLHARESGVKLLTRALSEHRVELHVQPVVDLRDDQPHSGEVLVRIRTNGDLMPAGEFIDAVHDLGEVVDLDFQVLSRIRQIAPRLADVTDRLFVNISPISLTSPVFLGALKDTVEGLRQDGIELPLVLELTEQALLEDPAVIARTHRELGVTFAIDDFGTGFSSLKMVSDLAVAGVVSHLKIDGSLTRALPHSEAVYKVVLAIVNLAKSLGVKVVAEHVENEAILAKLRTTGVELAQGNVFSPAIPLDELAKRYRRSQGSAPPGFSPAQLHILEPYLDKAFGAFYDALLSNPAFAGFFSGPAEIRSLTSRQRDTFLASLHDTPAQLRARWVRLGHLHHDLAVPFPSFLRGAEILSEELLEVLANVTNDGALIKNTLAFFASLKRYIARGYLDRTMAVDRESFAALREAMSRAARLAAHTHDGVFACMDGILEAIELDRPDLVPRLDADACPLASWIEDATHTNAPAAEAERLRQLHHQVHASRSSLAFSLETGDYASTLLVYRMLCGRFLMLANLLLADTAVAAAARGLAAGVAACPPA